MAEKRMIEVVRPRNIPSCGILEHGEQRDDIPEELCKQLLQQGVVREVSQKPTFEGVGSKPQREPEPVSSDDDN